VKKYVRSRAIVATGALVLAALTCAPATLAADLTDIGYVDQAALSQVRSFTDAQRQLIGYQGQLNREFQQEMRGAKTAQDQQRIASDFRGRLDSRQRELFGPLFARAQVAIASVASSKNLSVILDRRIIVYGGQDITKNVVDLLSSVSDPVPPVTTPPPSTVGFVDQAQVDQVPKLKTAADDFNKFQADLQRQTQTKLKAAKTDADRKAIYDDYQKTLADRQKSAIDPLVASTRDAIGSVAQKRGLVLVVDKTNLIFGGTDITSDVVAKLK
jgi:outer membrane protein